MLATRPIFAVVLACVVELRREPTLSSRTRVYPARTGVTIPWRGQCDGKNTGILIPHARRNCFTLCPYLAFTNSDSSASFLECAGQLPSAAGAVSVGAAGFG